MTVRVYKVSSRFKFTDDPAITTTTWDRYVDTLDAILHQQFQHFPYRSDDGTLKTFRNTAGYWLGFDRAKGRVLALTPGGGRLLDVWHPDVDHVVASLRNTGFPVDVAVAA